MRSPDPSRAPEFRVDPTWPTIPNGWVLGEVTSISVDRNDDVWVLHVPQSIPEDKRANAAPPVLKFDSAGKLLTSWGGPRASADWLGREHGIFVDADDFVWIGGRAGWPRATTPGVSDDMIMKFTMAGELVMQIGHSGQSTGNLDTENVHQATDVFVDTQANGFTPRTARQQASDRVRLGDREVQADVGRVRQPAPADVRAERPGAATADDARRAARIRLAARDQGVERRGRLPRGSDQQPHPAVHARGKVC
jgi:hypothetical protein